MAFTSLRASAEYESAVSGGTLTFSPTTDIEVGDTIDIGWDADVAGLTVSSCADNSSQPGAANVYVIRAPRSGTNFSFGTCYILKATRKILTTDVITITLSASTPTRRTGQMMAFVSGNGNPRFELPTGITAALASPVGQGASGTLYSANTMSVTFHAWKGGAVASGIGTLVPAAGVACPGGGALSGGASTRVELNSYYVLNLASTSSITPSASYTSITIAHGETHYFTDEPRDGRVPQVRAVGAAGGGAFGAGLTPVLPANPQPDDLMLLFVTLEESAALGGGSNPPTGWTSIGASVSVTGGGILYGFWRKWVLGDASPNLTWTPTTDGGDTQMIAIHCDTWDEATPFEDYNTSSEATVDTSWSYAPGTSTDGPNRLCWAMYTTGVDSGSGQGSGTPTNAAMSGIVTRINASTAGGLGAGFVGTTGIKAAAGAVGTWAGTLLAASAKAYHSFSIRPVRLDRGEFVRSLRVWAGR